MSIIQRVFEPIYGQLAWGVKNGVGSALTFEFGQPHVEVVREPMESRKKISARLRQHRARRIMAVHGDWHLWIWCCDWRFYSKRKLIGTSDSARKEIQQMVWDLEGQALTHVEVSRTGTAVFEFDLGGRLKTIPDKTFYQKKDLAEQWYLYEPSGNVLTLRADAYYNYGPMDGLPSDRWDKLETGT